MAITRRGTLRIGGSLATLSLAGCATVFEGDSATVAWETPITRSTGGVATREGTVYASTRDGVVAITVSGGEKEWDFHTGQDEPSSRPVIGNDTIFVGTMPFRDHSPARLYAISTAGDEIWNASLPSGATTATIHDQTVFIASGVMGGDAGLVAFNRQSGDKQWEISLPDHPVGSSPTIADETLFIESGGLAAFDAESGELRWRQPREQTEAGEAARRFPAVADGTVYFSHSTTPEVCAFDAETGERQWTAKTDAQPTSPLVADGTVFVGTTNRTPDSPDDTLYALDPATGDELWSVSTGNVPLEGPVIADGTIYSAGDDTLYAVAGSSGEILWEYEFDNGISTPVLTDEYAIVATPQSGSSGHLLSAVHR